MVIRSVDSSGDVLPILRLSDMTSGSKAIAELVKDRLNLFAGDWWENRSWGNQIIAMLRESKLTEADASTISAYLLSYVRETPGVQDVSDEAYAIENRRFSWSCTVYTDDGSTVVRYNI